MSATAQQKTVAPWESNPVRSLVRAFGLLERVMQPYFAQFGITGAQWGILRTLVRAERGGATGLRPTDLSARLLVRPPSISGALDRMERDGLVARDPLATDLRAKRVRLTTLGRQKVAQILNVHERQLRLVLSALADQEQAVLQSLLDRLGAHLEVLASEEDSRRRVVKKTRVHS